MKRLFRYAVVIVALALAGVGAVPLQARALRQTRWPHNDRQQTHREQNNDRWRAAPQPEYGWHQNRFSYDRGGVDRRISGHDLDREDQRGNERSLRIRTNDDRNR